MWWRDIAAFGDSPEEMRALSVLATAGAAACVTRPAAGWPAPGRLLAGLVFALVPSVSRSAPETRSYDLEVLVGRPATLLLLLLLRALDMPGVRRGAVYGVCLAALGYLDLAALAADSPTTRHPDAGCPEVSAQMKQRSRYSVNEG